MSWVLIPGYGIWPRSSVRPLSKSRIIGQASRDFLGEDTGMGIANPAAVYCVKRGGKLLPYKHHSGGEDAMCRLPDGRTEKQWDLFQAEGMSDADERLPIRFPNVSPEGMKAHQQVSKAFGVDPRKRHGFDALLELVEEDQRAFENPTPRQAEDQAEKMAETVRVLAQYGVAHDVDWLTFTSPEVRNGKPTVVIGVNPAVVVGRSASGVPLVNLHGKQLPVAPSKINGRPVEFRITDVEPHTNNLTGTPGGAGGMGSLMKLNIDMNSGLSLNPLLIKSLKAHCGTYVRNPDNSWCFVLDPLLRIKLLLRGVEAPCAVSADKIIGWNTVPTEPLIGGFTHPIYGVHARAASIPVEWDTLTHGTPEIRLTGYNMLADAPGPDAPEQMTPLESAEGVARGINADIGALVGKPPKWWLYTLPLVEKDGRAVVKIGVKGDYQPDAKELKALPWAKWVSGGVELQVEFVPPEGSGIKGTVAKITPEGLAGVGMADMSSAPVDVVWPTDSPDYQEPTGDGTGDDDPAMSGYDGAVCPKCGGPATGATRCIPGAYFCANGHEWPRTASSGLGHGFPARVRMPSTHMHPQQLGDDPRCATKTGTSQDIHCAVYGTAMHPMDPRHPRWAKPRPAADDSGMGAAPVVAMPTGMLNWDRVSGYEGQPWVTKDWSGQGFLDGSVTEYDDTFMGDMGQAGASGQPAAQVNRSLVFGAGAAAVCAAAGWLLAPGGDARKAAIVGGIGGGIAGLIVGKLIGGAESAITSFAAAAKPTAPVPA